jgi:hypothetical protein
MWPFWYYIAGRQWFLRSSLIHSLPDEVIHKTVMQFADTPIGCSKCSALPCPALPSPHILTLCSHRPAWIFELSGGAIADFEDTCLPKEQREAIWTVAALHQWEMGINDPRCITTAEAVRHLFTSCRLSCPAHGAAPIVDENRDQAGLGRRAVPYCTSALLPYSFVCMKLNIS